MFRCFICEAEFDEPNVRTERRKDEDGFSEVLYEEVCPCCGNAYFEEVDEDAQTD